jgi:1,4-dihydroxy-6-naphthoate synthase
MFYPIMEGKIPLDGFSVTDVREDIESLNQKAKEGVYDVTAVSFHVYPYIADKYLLLSTGACFGDQYGPVVVASKALKPKQLLKVRIGIPGKMTSAFLALKLYEQQLAGEGKSGVCYSQVPFDQIMEQVEAGKLDAGLIIHEGQLSFSEKGLHKIVDLGEWWHKETGLPLPLGGIAIRRDLAPEIQKKVGLAIQQSIRYSLEHKEESLAKALPFARGLDPERADKFIGMYVNDYTVDFGRKGLKSIKLLLEKGYQQGIITQSVELDDCIFDVKKGAVKKLSSPSPEPSPEEPSSSVPSPDAGTDVP